MAVQMIQEDTLLTFKEAMSYLRVSRSTLYRLMWSGHLIGHKVGSAWRFYREDLYTCVGRETSAAILSPTILPPVISVSRDIKPSAVTISSDVLPSVINIPAGTLPSSRIN